MSIVFTDTVKVKTIEKFFFFLFPLSLLKGTPWETMWLEQEKKDFYLIARIFFFITFVGYILHYYTVDRAEGLAPSELWFNYRFGMAGLSLSCLLVYSFAQKKLHNLLYKFPAIIACGIFCYYQTRSIIWYPNVPYLYSFAFVLVCVSIVRTTILKSIVISSIYLVLIYPTLIESGLSAAMAFSASFFTNAVIVFVTAKYTSDLKYFIAVQDNYQQQKKIIEINMEFTNQIKSFLPGEIARRLTEHIQEKRMPVVQAIDNVLRPKKQFVACLFSDVRGFTKKSEDLDGFVAEALFPDIKASTVAVEKHQGISRKIGDLIFAYFDFNEKGKCIKMAFEAAVELSFLNQKLNENLEENIKIKRYILLSCGEAIVGNLSSYDSAIEITAIGSPVNILSRIDEVTKHQLIKEKLISGDIILTENFYKHLKDVMPEVQSIEIKLEHLNLKIRDFETTKSIYLFRRQKINTVGAAA